MRVMLAAPQNEPGLLGSYGRALDQLGVRVSHCDIQAAIDRSARLGLLGRRFNSSIPIPAWEARGNREFILAAREARPDAIFIAGSARIGAGALAQIRAALSGVRLALVWPDTLLNLTDHTIASLPLYDLVATYSQRSIDSFEKLGARNVRWVPFAADTILFRADVDISPEHRQRFSCDVVFIGNGRPERERAILALMDSGMSVKVWGANTWLKGSLSPARARRYWQGGAVFGADFVRATQCAHMALNVIDDTNYPAANMRFFENMACRAVSLVSPCPEMEGTFPEGSGVVYFSGLKELVAKARWLLTEQERRLRIADEGYRRVLAGHTYADRARDLLVALGLSPVSAS